MIEDFKTGMINSSKKYSNVVLLCSDDLYEFEYSKSFPSRHFHLGSSVANMLAAAVGFACRGKLPFVLLNAEDVLGALEQIERLIVKANMNVKIVAVGGDKYKKILQSIEGLELHFPDEKSEIVELVGALVNSYGPSYLALRP